MAIDSIYSERLDSKKDLAVTKRKAKQPRWIDKALRRTLANNLVRRMEARYPQEDNKRQRLADDAGVGRSTINRIVNQSNAAPTIDSLSQISRALRCDTWELLKPE